MKFSKIFLTLSILFFSFTIFADYNKALKLYDEGKYKDSLTELASLLDIERDMEEGAPNYDIRFLAGHCHWKLKSYDNALIHLRRCSDMKPNATEPYIDIALILIDTKNYRDSASYAQKALKIDSKNAMAYFILGQIKLKQKSYWAAKEYFEKSTEFNTDLYASWNGLGLTLMSLKKYMEANTAFATASALNPDSAEIYSNLAVSYMKTGNKQEALMYINKALQIDPENNQIKANQKAISSM